MRSPLTRLARVLAHGFLLVPLTVHANGWEHTAIPFDALVAALEFDEAGTETRRRAAESLGFRRQAEAVEPLMDVLSRPEPDDTVRGAIYTALGRIGDSRALRVLVKGLDEESRDVLRGTCALAIGALGDQRGLDPLLAALTDDPSQLVRVRSIDALGHFDDARSIEALAGVLAGKEDAGPRLHAIAALGNTRSEAAVRPLLWQLAREPGRDERLAIADALARIGSPGALGAIESQLRTSRDPEIRTRFTVALAATRDGSAYPGLLAMSADPNPAVRYFAVRGLHDLGRAEAAAPLARLSLDISKRLDERSIDGWLREPAPVLAELALQTASLRAIADLDASTGLHALLTAARPIALPRDSATALELSEGVFEVRRIAVYGLGYSRSKKAATFLAGANGAGDPDFRLRATAARSLGVLGMADAGGVLRTLLSDPAAEVRWTAAAVLGRLNDPASGGALVASLADRHPEVRAQAALSLGYLGYAAARPRLETLISRDESHRVREAAAFSATLLAR